MEWLHYAMTRRCTFPRHSHFCCKFGERLNFSFTVLHWTAVTAVCSLYWSAASMIICFLSKQTEGMPYCTSLKNLPQAPLSTIENGVNCNSKPICPTPKQVCRLSTCDRRSYTTVDIADTTTPIVTDDILEVCPAISQIDGRSTSSVKISHQRDLSNPVLL